MISSEKAILKMPNNHSLAKAPLRKEQIQPASADIRLGDTFSMVENSSGGIITMGSEILNKTIKANQYLLFPGQFALATTKETITLPVNLTAFVEGSSSLGKMGLLIQNAG